MFAQQRLVGNLLQVALQLGERELDAARLLHVLRELLARAHDAVEPAPAHHGDDRQHGDRDQQFD
ncbi:hypothetical protein ACN9MU_21305 [Pseudoduganella sp. R-32]|uniref:hypothetical protein n=1 Tax=Pseudoduganella sp. R-32 TaxID=3404061 RepID=UPI003CE7905E